MINGEERKFDDVVTAKELVEKLGLVGRPMALELNHQLLPSKKFDVTTLSDGDKIEIVTFVGGG